MPRAQRTAVVPAPVMGRVASTTPAHEVAVGTSQDLPVWCLALGNLSSWNTLSFFNTIRFPESSNGTLRFLFTTWKQACLQLPCTF